HTTSYRQHISPPP
ncbi:hypothetical protein TrRE_jg6210, partial [Triparma retinervis]